MSELAWLCAGIQLKQNLSVRAGDENTFPSSMSRFESSRQGKKCQMKVK